MESKRNTNKQKALFHSVIFSHTNEIPFPKSTTILSYNIISCETQNKHNNLLIVKKFFSFFKKRVDNPLYYNEEVKIQMTNGFEKFANTLVSNISIMPWWASFILLAGVILLYFIRLSVTSIRSIKKGETELTFSVSIKKR
ncbi:hypothetical protein M3596_21985 [Bacillus subtilis]|uniref:hypothetical protein n=1 Tax=Bacillus subtilis TaxID=1423 RepID=UPI00203A5144|nr:hypothetical protein [Bacillus subtilis]MCM3191385.1 hypothetical protein [Bacillus subtilis]